MYHLKKLLDLKLEVYNTLGQIIYTKQYVGFNPSLMEIPSSRFDEGIYGVTLSNSKGKIWSSWLVKM